MKSKCAFNICSSYINFHNELLKIKHILANNCFPSALVDGVIRKFLNERFSPSNKPPVPEQSKQRIVFCIPFLGHLSFKLRNNITKLIKSHYPDIKLQFIYKSPKRLSSIFKFRLRAHGSGSILDLFSFRSDPYRPRVHSTGTDPTQRSTDAK